MELNDSQVGIKLEITQTIVSCGSCKYWDKEDFRISSLPRDFNGMGVCTKHTHERTQNMKEELADAICFTEGIGGEFITREAFGCVSGAIVSQTL